MKLTVCLLFAFVSVGSLAAAPAFDPVFGDGMVLQRDKPVWLWGTASPGAEVVVSFGAHQAKTDADSEKGFWKTSLPGLEASSIPAELTLTSGGSTVVISDVLVGEVWLCSGQSNMAWTLAKCVDGAAEAEAASDPLIRVNRTGTWEACTGDVAAKTSGVAYYFAKKLRSDDPEVPVGLIVRAVGGTPVEYWTPVKSLKKLDYAQQTLKRFSSETEEGKNWLAYAKAQAEWKEIWKKNRQLKAKGKPIDPAGTNKNKPSFDGSPDAIVLAGIYSGENPGGLWRRLIQPVQGFTISGALWYQGERNSKAGTQNAETYDQLLATMITSWREAWGQGDFRFLVVQLPSFARGGDNWAIIQKSQAAAVSMVPNADYVDISDLPDGGLHPMDKKPVGERLAAKAFAE